MKVVLIAESEDTIKDCSSFLEESGADVITYRWFLKALDNLTEIQPHIIIVSALDFPRHWKTLFTHIETGEIKTRPLVYLISGPSFTEEEKEKAMFLGVQDIFSSPLTERDKASLLSMLPSTIETVSEEPENNESVQFSFINPLSGLVVTGSVLSYEHPALRFVPSSKESIEGIRFGQILEKCRFTYEGEQIMARAQVHGIGEEIEFCLLY